MQSAYGGGARFVGVNRADKLGSKELSERKESIGYTNKGILRRIKRILRRLRINVRERRRHGDASESSESGEW